MDEIYNYLEEKREENEKIKERDNNIVNNKIED